MDTKRRLLASIGASILLLTTSGCKSPKRDDENINDLCIKEHFDESVLNIETLDNGSKYISDINVKSSLRKKFISNNNILNSTYSGDSRVQEIFNNVKYLYLFDEETVKAYVEQFIKDRENKFKIKLTTDEIIEQMMLSNDFNKISYILTFDSGSKNYYFNLYSNLTSYESIMEEVKCKNINFSKNQVIYNMKNNEYDIKQNYVLSSSKNSNDSITIELNCEFEISNSDIINNCKCHDSKNVLYMKKGPEYISILVNEIISSEIIKLMVASVNNEVSMEQFLIDNNDILKDLFKEQYDEFIRIDSQKVKRLS